jgi:flagellar biosynthesis/type III secretory pathway chaperone
MLDTVTVADLIEAMREQLTVLRDLAEIGDKKTQVLITANLADLDVLVQGEQALLVRLNRVESKRYSLQQALAAQAGVVVEEFTFSRLLTVAAPESAKVLSALQAEYQTLMARLNTQQETNAALIHQALQYVDFSLKVITGAGTQPKSGTYTAQGQRQSAPGTRPNKVMDGRV